MAQDPISQELARIVNEKLDRVIGKQTEHTIALANHTASLDRLERDVSEIKTCCGSYSTAHLTKAETRRTRILDVPGPLGPEKWRREPPMEAGARRTRF